MVLKRKNYYTSGAIINERLWLFILSIIASILNYVFQIYIGRKLTVGNYGKYNFIMAFISNSYSFYAPLSVIVCRLTSENGRNIHNNRFIYNQVMKVFALVSFLMVIFLGIYCYVLNYSDISWVLFISTIFFSSLCSVMLGVIQGLAKYMIYGIFTLIMMITKLLLTFFFARDVRSTIYCILVSEIVVLFLSVFFILNVYHEEDISEKKDAKKISMQELVYMYGGTLWVLFLNSLFINNGEILLLKKVYSDDVLGLYSVASTLGRVGMYTSTIISTIILPEIAYKKSKGIKTTISSLNVSLLVSLGISSIYLLVLILFKDIFIQKLYGEAYLGVGEIIERMRVFIIGITILPIINSFYLGINKLKSIILIYVFGIMMAISCTYIFNKGFDYLIKTYGIIILVVDLFAYIVIVLNCKLKKIS